MRVMPSKRLDIVPETVPFRLALYGLNGKPGKYFCAKFQPRKSFPDTLRRCCQTGTNNAAFRIGTEDSDVGFGST